ncbi:hypothetical protein PA598K_06794 [Paenibacillus sp. 598K]|uniref:DUF3024 domain-containing protein n=1 Tax=Paenibacillus sp. 598K TaxID=1117987 RepID=UPI000FF958CB|nr:DUF3024 domain-containing protein [Paenibacillus sp. 598K]GBF78184.1 hypothetical protein PA598K_06794 [Paenibacillus sp. 598K]
MDPFTVRRLEKILDGYIEAKVPQGMRASIRLIYEWEGDVLTLCERRLSYPELGWSRADIVQFRLEAGGWCVYAKGEDGSFMPVSAIEPDPDFERQLEQVELDPEGLFWIS